MYHVIQTPSDESPRPLSFIQAPDIKGARFALSHVERVHTAEQMNV